MDRIIIIRRRRRKKRLEREKREGLEQSERLRELSLVYVEVNILRVGGWARVRTGFSG